MKFKSQKAPTVELSPSNSSLVETKADTNNDQLDFPVTSLDLNQENDSAKSVQLRRAPESSNHISDVFKLEPSVAPKRLCKHAKQFRKADSLDHYRD